MRAAEKKNDFRKAAQIINEKYGGARNYLRNQIGLTESEIQQFRSYYLE